MSNTESIEKLLRIYERRLQIYEEQRATYDNSNVPAHLIIEIETVQEEIKKLKQQLPGGKREIVSEIGIEKQIYISYAWSGESEKIVERLDQAFQARGVTIIRDKRDLGYKGRIKAFMERIGRGKGVIVVVSEKYLKSENCMFELVQIAKNGRFYDRIFPIVLADANIYDPLERLMYVEYWEEKIKKLDEAMKRVGAANLQGFREDIDSYTEIRRTIAELTNILKDMNTLTPGMHSQEDFETLFKAIEQKMAE